MQQFPQEPSERTHGRPFGAELVTIVPTDTLIRRAITLCRNDTWTYGNVRDDQGDQVRDD